MVAYLVSLLLVLVVALEGGPKRNHAHAFVSPVSPLRSTCCHRNGKPSLQVLPETSLIPAVSTSHTMIILESFLPSLSTAAAAVDGATAANDGATAASIPPGFLFLYILFWVAQAVFFGYLVMGLPSISTGSSTRDDSILSLFDALPSSFDDDDDD